MDKTDQEIVDELVAKNKELAAGLVTTDVPLKELVPQIETIELSPNRAQRRRHYAVRPEAMSSTVARARRKIRRRIARASRQRNRAQK